MIDLKNAKKKDPVKRNVEKGMEGEEWSPMNPPEAFEQPGDIEQVAYENLPQLLKDLCDEHQQTLDHLDTFEKILLGLKNNQWTITSENNEKLKGFFTMVDDVLMPHQRTEEKVLFPLLKKRLLEYGEHSNAKIGTEKRTAIDILEDDHLKAIQLSGLVFNLLGISSRLPDQDSRLMMLDATYEQGMAIIELLKLHIHREEATIFPLACQYISTEEFEELEAKREYC